MQFLQFAQNFLIRYDWAVMLSLFGGLLLFGATNWCNDLYFQQNRKLEKCRRSIVADPDNIPLHVQSLPQEYRRQWRAFVNTGAAKPSLAFEFVPKSKVLYFARLFGWCTFFCTLYASFFVAMPYRRDYLIFQVAYLLAVVLVFVLYSALCRKNERRARACFGKFVAELNRHLCCQSNQTPSLQQTIVKLNDLRRGAVTEHSLNCAAELIQRQPTQTRSVEQQRKLNVALNDLLQAYARQAGKKPNC